MKSRAFSIICALCVAAFGLAMAEDKPAADKPAAPAGPRNVYVIQIHGGIDKPMMAFLARAVEKAKWNNATHVIFSIDTWGGRVDSTQEITSIIASAEPAMTIAFVPSGAESRSFFSGSPVKGASWSAGALIAMGCRRIYMAPGTSIGAAAPVYQTAEGMQMAPEKEVSAMRGYATSLAEKNGYPKSIALKMVELDLELIEVTVDGKYVAVTEDDLIDIEKEAATKNQKVEKTGKVISAAGKLLTLSAGEAERYGFSSGTVANVNELCTKLEIQNAPMVWLKQTLADDIVAFIVSVPVTTLLVIIGLVALYIEISHPGVALPGSIAVLSFAIIFGSNYLLGRVGSIEILMFLVGVSLIVAELFLIPGFGVAGISGIVLIIASLVLSMQGFTVPEFSWQWDLLEQNLVSVIGGFALSLIIIAIVARYMANIPLLNRLRLTTAQQPEQGYTVQTQEAVNELMGKRGVTATILRPSGKAEIDGKVIAVETDGEFLPSGTPVEVVEVNSNRVLVRKS